MTFISKVFQYFKKEDKDDFEIKTYDPLRNDNYFESFHSIILENNFKGTIVCLGDIHIKKNASFSGELICRSCRIEGSFSGNLLSTEHTGVCNTAILDAKIMSASIFIENNAVVKGIFNITTNIVNPAPIQKLHEVYRQSVPVNDEIEDTQGTPEIKRIILRGIAANVIKTKPELPTEVTAPQIKNPDVIVDTLTPRPENKMNRSENLFEPSENSGWW